MGIINLNDEIELSKNKKTKVIDIVNNKQQIFKLLRKGFWFSDEVLERAGIKKTIRDVKIKVEYVDDKEVDNKKYSKDKESIKNILKKLHTLENNDKEYVDELNEKEHEEKEEEVYD